MAFTPFQCLARDKEGSNIIVSAGAGSGKTSVLSARILRIVKKGIPLSRLLVLTFTNSAALEMKTRIKNIIKNDEEVKDRASEVDNAYITTFDSYSLSLVKKYHYLLGIDQSVSIIDGAVINLKKKEIIEEIFNEYYDLNDPTFNNFIATYAFKDDKIIKEFIFNTYQKLVTKIDKDEYLTNYEKLYLNDKFYSYLASEVEVYYLTLLEQLIELYEEFNELLNEKEFAKFNNYLEGLKSISSYDELTYFFSSVSKPRKPAYIKGDDEILHENIKKFQEQFKLKFSSLNEIKDYLRNSEKMNILVIDILRKLDIRLNEYKNKYQAYEFIDLSKMAIKCLKENPSELKALKESLYEILLDEYQDTNDIQEEFVKLIENNNVYMVGDVKQSIYRFRNANPEIFTNKYEDYKSEEKGIKIDLTNNFRSRPEVVEAINDIFNPLMTLKHGGAIYEKDHQMLFGNTNYLNGGRCDSIDYNMTILTYKYEDNLKKFDYINTDMYLTCLDIKEKIASGFKIMDQKTNTLRNLEYRDIAIIIDEGVNFNLFKKALNYHGIPAFIIKNDEVTSDSLVNIFANILKAISYIYQGIYDNNFLICYLSIARSFLVNYSDDYLVNLMLDKSYKSSELFKTLKEISNDLLIKSNEELIQEIITKFDIYNKLYSIGNVKKSITRLEYINNLANNFLSLNLTGLKFIEEISKLLESGFKVEIPSTPNSENAVTLITIHKSKGLEYPLVYMPLLNKSFKHPERSKGLYFSLKYGLISSYKPLDEMVDNPLQKIENYYNYKETISEKIRLFYVGLTRCREKLILIRPQAENKNKKLTDFNKDRLSSFVDILDLLDDRLIKYKEILYLDELTIDSNFRYETLTNEVKYNKTEKKISVHSNNIESKEIEALHSSKVVNKLIDYSTKEKMQMGDYVHKLLETLNFVNPNYENIDNHLVGYFKAFLSQDFLPNLKECKIYKEYEFSFIGDKKYHGIIDLLIETEDELLIIDYKLKNIDDDNYDKQLNSYKDYLISLNTGKKIKMILYSFFDKTYRYVD